MDNRLLKILIEDAMETVSNLDKNIDNASILQYFAGKLTLLSKEIVTCLAEK
ncbi:MAG: hypothetical protein MJ180_00960 [Candidatus Gastranaerophilales bacterium]|nr:hypothetical protein [Candidatus Gastranaerophilales bacterium]